MVHVHHDSADGADQQGSTQTGRNWPRRRERARGSQTGYGFEFTLTRPLTNPRPYTLKPSTLNCEELTMLTQLHRPAKAQFLAVILRGSITIQDYTGLL